MNESKSPILSGFLKEFEARGADPKDVAGRVKYYLEKYKVVKLTNGFHISDLRSFYDELTDSLGRPHDIAEDYAAGGTQTGERWMEIRYDADVPDDEVYRHSKNGQPLHTDESYISQPCDIMVFYCVNKAEVGGQTVFVDGLRLVQRMEEIAPDLLGRVSSTLVCYEKAGSRRLEKIIDLSDPENPLLNFNYHCISQEESSDNKSLNREFHRFLEENIKGSYLEQAVGLSPGESVFWWDRHVLHGRNPFVASVTDDRLIWKTGVSWIDE